MAYRVFISYKHTSMDGKSVTKDYAIAADLHKTLTQAGIPTFFSEKDLSTGDYINEIYDALEEADIMIVVGTRPEHIRSRWVKEEWSTFGAAINGNLKPNGDIYTFLDGMSVTDLPMMLYKRQSYTTREKAALVQRVKSQLGIKDEPQPVQESKPEPAKESKPQPVPKPAKEKKPKAKTTAVKRTPIIVTVAVVLVLAIVGGIWAISNSTNDSTESVKSLSELGTVSVGDYFTFGSYPQGANGEVQLIEWRVLAVEDGKALVISEKLLDSLPYYNGIFSVTWETCQLRNWMNNDFLNKSFSSTEQEMSVIMV